MQCFIELTYSFYNSRKVRMHVSNINRITRIYNVIGTIKGSLEPGESLETIRGSLEPGELLERLELSEGLWNLVSH